MKIGLYLAYPPSAVSYSLKQEGLGRYMSFLIKAFVSKGHKITIACPKWILSSIEELLEEENIDKTYIEFLIPKSEPILYSWYVRLFIKKPKAKKRKRGKLAYAAFRLMDKVITGLISTKNILIFSFFIILVGVIGIILLPFALIACVAFLIIKLARSIFKFIFKNQNPVFTFRNLMGKIRRRFKLAAFVYDQLSGIFRPEIIKEKIRISSANDMIGRMKYIIDPPETWYCPMAFWPEFNKLPGTKVLCVPDLVTTEFSTKFSLNRFSKATDEVRKTIDGAEYFITYCDYVKKSLLIDRFGKNSDNIISIEHAVNQTLDFINLKKNFNRKELEYDVNLYYARNIILRSVTQNAAYMHDYLQYPEMGFSFKDVKYIFYSSQLRPNKNIMSLIKAYEYILREKFIPIKLFLTCNLDADKEIKDYIYNNRLQYDILCFHSVNNQQLASLYMCAELVVNPTLYEGGFPFTFGEGMSVGTPSIMSNIPQVTEVTDAFHLKKFIFNPYDFRDIANKIIYGLQNREELIKCQTPLYNYLSKRTWDEVGQEYVQAFEYFTKLSKKD